MRASKPFKPQSLKATTGAHTRKLNRKTSEESLCMPLAAFGVEGGNLAHRWEPESKHQESKQKSI